MYIPEPIQQELTAGRIPKEFEEKELLYRPTDAIHPVTEAYFQSIAHKILKNLPKELKDDLLDVGIDPLQLDLQFRFGSSDKLQGAIFPASNRPLIIISKGLWGASGNEDEIAGVIAHEINHKLQKYLFKGLTNKKLEEFKCDVYTVETLRNAEYKQDALTDFFKRLPIGEPSFLGTVSDEHPTNGNRVRALDMACNHLESQIGKQGKHPGTPKDAQVDQAIQAARYANYSQHWLRAQGYDQADPVHKLELIADLSDRIIHESTDPYVHFRFGQIGQILNVLKDSNYKLDEHNPREVSAFKRLVHDMLTLHREGQDDTFELADKIGNAGTAGMYHALLTISKECQSPELRCEATNGYAILGEHIAFQKAFKRFIEASSLAEAEQAAEAILSCCNAYPQGISGHNFFAKRLPHFENPFDDERKRNDIAHKIFNARTDAQKLNEVMEQYGVEPEWRKHLEWAAQSPLVEMGLSLAGVRPRRLSPAAYEAAKSRGVSKEMVAHFEGANTEPYQYSPTGKILGREHDYVGLFSEPAPEKPREFLTRPADDAEMARREAWKQELGSTKESWSQFTRKYAAYLAPEHDGAQKTGSSAFAAAFLAHAAQLAETDTDTYKPLVNHWFTHDLYSLIDAQTASFSRPEIDDNEAFVRFALENPGHVLEIRPRLEALFFTSLGKSVFNLDKYSANDISEVAAFWPTPPWPLMETVAPDSPENERTVLHHLTHLRCEDRRSNILGNALKQTACLFMAHHAPDECSVDDLRALAFVTHYMRYDDRFMQEPINQYILAAANHALAHVPLAELADYFTTLQAAGEEPYKGTGVRESSWFSDHPELQRAFEARFKKEIPALKDDAQSVSITSKLLYDAELHLPGRTFEEPLVYAGSHFKDPELSSALVEKFVDAQVALKGGIHNETNGDDYIKLTKEITEHTSGKLRYDLLATLAETSQAQRELSYFMERSTRKESASKGAMGMHTMLAGFAEAAFNDICANPKTRLAFLQFLRTPYDQDSSNKFDKTLSRNLRIRTVFDQPYENLDPNVRHDMLRATHNHFRALPDEWQLAALDLITFPTEGYSSKTFEEGKRYAYDQVLPLPLLKRSNKKDNAMGRYILDSYFGLEENPERMNRAMLSAMLCGEDPQEGQQPRRGKALTKLGMLGPGGDKLVQGISSYPGTPQDIRDDTKKSKYKASPPPRWDVHHWLDERGPANIECVGKVLGSGSYGVTVELFKSEGPEDQRHVACTLLRPHARKRALEEFTSFYKTAEKAAQKYPQLAPLPSIVKHAREYAIIETDMDYAAQQYQVAYKQTEGFKVTIDGEEGTFHSTKWVGHGPEYKETLIASGEHLFDYAKHQPEEQILKTAMRLLTKHLYLKFAGKPTDSDRHFGQQLIEGADVYEFDYGCQTLKAPGTDEKKLMTHILAKALKASAGFMGTGWLAIPMEISISHEINKALQEHPDKNIYLGEMQRELIALTDYLDIVRPHKDSLKEIIGAIWKQGDVDPVIRQTLQEDLGKRGIKYLDRLAAKHGDRIAIEPVQHAQAPDIPAAATPGAAQDRPQPWIDRIQPPENPPKPPAIDPTDDDKGPKALNRNGRSSRFIAAAR